MTENSMTPGKSDGSVKALMETLHAQQELLQLLYTELDVEREAAATAASESLGMILRLQGEKAAVEMEASQYKRIAEEKMVHTEETLEVFRDVMYQKEMQVASLEFQVQAFRYKLMSLGCNDASEGECAYPENILIRRGRACSLPPNFLKDGEDTRTDDEVSVESSVKVFLEIKDEDLGHGKSGDFSSYSDQIRRLDERVKQLSSSKDLSYSGDKLNEVSRSCSSHDSFYDAVRGELTPRVGVTEACEHLLDTGPSRDPVTPLKVHDIFEVPQHTPNGGELADLPQNKEKGKLSPEDEIDPVTPFAIKTVISDEMVKENWDRRIPMSPDVDNVFHKPRDGLAAEHLFLKRPEVTDLELHRRLQRLEDDIIVARLEMPRQEITVEKDDDKLLLLNAIKDQLNSIEVEITQWRPKSPPPKKELNCTSFIEAMLHFWPKSTRTEEP